MSLLGDAKQLIETEMDLPKPREASSIGVVTNPLIPREKLPPRCAALGCRFRLATLGGLGVIFEHHHGGTVQMQGTLITDDDLVDLDVPIWSGQVSPWLERLHEEPEA